MKDDEVAREVAQECFLRLIQSNLEVESERAVGWLFRECRNRSIDIWRKQRKTDSYGSAEEIPQDFSASNPWIDLEKSKDLQRLHLALEKLSAKHREVIWLKFNEGLSYKQIAEVMNISASNAGFILFEAMRELREVSAVELGHPTHQKKGQYGE